MINKQKISINYSITETEIIKRRRLKERPSSFNNAIIHKKSLFFFLILLVIRKKMIIWKASDMGFLIYQFITSNRPLKMKFFYLWGKRGLLEFWPRPTPSRGQIKVDIWKVITGLNPVSYTSTYAGASETSVRCAWRMFNPPSPLFHSGPFIVQRTKFFRICTTGFSIHREPTKHRVIISQKKH